MVTVEVFLVGLMACSIFTGLVTEAVKKMCEDKYEFNSNILAAIVSIVVSTIICVFYSVLNEVDATGKWIVVCASLCILSWICAMVGYDKVKQAIADIITKKGA